MKNLSPHVLFFCMLFTLTGCMVFDSENELELLVENLQSENEMLVSDEIRNNKQDDVLLKSGERQSFDIKGSFEISSNPVHPGPRNELLVSGKGNVSHMGKSKLLMQKIVTVDIYANPPVWDASATLSITAANGDELHLEYDNCDVNVSDSQNYVFKAECMVSGGTGKFKNASGKISYYEIFVWSEIKPTGRLKISGSLTY